MHSQIQDTRRQREELDRKEKRLVAAIVKEGLKNKTLIGQLLKESVNNIFYRPPSSQSKLDKSPDKPDPDEKNVSGDVEVVKAENRI